VLCELISQSYSGDLQSMETFITGPPNGLASVVIVVCNVAGVPAGHVERSVGMLLAIGFAFGRVDGQHAGSRARGQSGGRHCMAGQYCYVLLGRHLVTNKTDVSTCVRWWVLSYKSVFEFRHKSIVEYFVSHKSVPEFCHK